jgi:FkbM family methyltransferase
MIYGGKSFVLCKFIIFELILRISIKMSYISNFISNFNNRSVYKESCTKSGLIPMKMLIVCVNLARFLRLYKFIYTISLVLSNIINRKKLIKFYSQFITKDDLCFDIGANIGSRTEVFLRLGAKVVSVEPQNNCMKKLRQKYSSNKQVSLIHQAVSDFVGEEEIMISNAHTVSSMSPEWIDSLKASDMFFVSTSAFQWQKSAKVKVTTLDKIIQEYGKPSFCKIDVEGYEYKVLKGLSKPIGTISFEFTPTKEFIDSAMDTVKHLASIGEVKFNYSLGESMTLALENWVTTEEISKILPTLSQKTSFCGDIYAKFI